MAGRSAARLLAPNEYLYGIANGTNPPVILRTLFKTLNIRQSSPLATLTNTLTVALSPSFDLAYSDRAVITISGILNGITSDDSIAMSGNGSKIFSDGNTTGRLEYGNEDNLVRLHLAPNQTMLKDTVYTFSFNLTNPKVNQAEGVIKVSASCLQGSEASIPPLRMRVPNATILGVVKGSNPLLVVIPTLKRSIIAQSDPLVGKRNNITVTLISNVDLAGDEVTLPVGLDLREWYYTMEASVIRISGFSNAISSRAVTLLPEPGGNGGHLLFASGGNSARGVFESEALTLTLDRNQTLLSETRYEFTFEIQNPAAEQPAPAISIEATGTALVERERLQTPHLPVIGVLNGSDAMLVEDPSFDLKHIAQSIPLAFYRNVYTVTLKVRACMCSGSLSRCCCCCCSSSSSSSFFPCLQSLSISA